MFRSTWLTGATLCTMLYAQCVSAAQADTGTAAQVPAAAHRPEALAPPPALDARRLAVTESMLKYCLKAGAAEAAGLQRKLARLKQGASDEKLTGLRKTTEYQASYDAVTDFVSKVDERNSRKVCAEALAKGR